MLLDSPVHPRSRRTTNLPPYSIRASVHWGIRTASAGDWANAVGSSSASREGIDMGTISATEWPQLFSTGLPMHPSPAGPSDLCNHQARARSLSKSPHSIEHVLLVSSWIPLAELSRFADVRHSGWVEAVGEGLDAAPHRPRRPRSTVSMLRRPLRLDKVVEFLVSSNGLRARRVIALADRQHAIVIRADQFLPHLLSGFSIRSVAPGLAHR